MSPKAANSRALDQPDAKDLGHTDNGSDNVCLINCLNQIQPRSKEERLLDLKPYERRRLTEHFWSKVDRRGPDDCWPWLLSCESRGGYGQFTYRFPDKQAHFVAHRIAWLLTHGTSAGRLFVCHRCDHPPCCNPAHHFLGTGADNLDDAREKGRLVDGHHLIKVSDEGLEDIRRNYRPRHNGRALAAKYGITLVSLLRIVKGTQRVSKGVTKQTKGVAGEDAGAAASENAQECSLAIDVHLFGTHGACR